MPVTKGLSEYPLLRYW